MASAAVARAEQAHKNALAFCLARGGRGEMRPRQFSPEEAKAAGYSSPKSAANCMGDLARKGRHYVVVNGQPGVFDFHPDLLREAEMGQEKVATPKVDAPKSRKRRGKKRKRKGRKSTSSSRSRSPARTSVLSPTPDGQGESEALPSDAGREQDPVARGKKIEELSHELDALETQQLEDFEVLFSQMTMPARQKFLEKRTPQELGRALNAIRMKRKEEEEKK